MKVLIGCEFSGVVRQAFRARGHDAWSCDLLPAEDDSPFHRYDQIIQPWMFGHPETKATCLWLRNLTKLTPTKIVDGRTARVHCARPGPDRWKERSRTLKGIADAMAEQWGSL